MKRRQFLAWTAAPVLAHSWDIARAQPAQALRLVFPFPAGGAGDALARLLAAELKVALDRPVVVENRTGAAGRIGLLAVRDSGADRATLLLTPSAPMVVYPHLYENLGYDAVHDFIPLARVAAFEMAIVIDPAIPARTLQEVAAWLKENPAKAHYGTPGTGTLAHLVMTALSAHWALPLVHVPYRGTPPALSDIAGGQLSMACSAIGEMLPAHQSGRVRLVATSGSERSVFSPDTPTLRETGVPFSALNWYGLYLPAGNSPATVGRLAAAVNSAMQAEGFIQKVQALGFLPAPSDGAVLAAAQREESQFWERVIRSAQIRVEQ